MAEKVRKNKGSQIGKDTPKRKKIATTGVNFFHTSTFMI